MTGWEKVGALTALYVVGMLWANWAMLRNVRGAVAERATWTVADFDAVFADCAPEIPPIVRELLLPWYGDGVVPQPDDTLRRFLKMTRDDVDDVVVAAMERLPIAPSTLPELRDVSELTRFVDAQWQNARARPMSTKDGAGRL